MSVSRQIAGQEVSPISLGCMNLSHAYGTPPGEAESIHLLNHALDMGYNMLDTAALYGFGANEQLLNKAVMHRRDEFLLASKGGMFKNAEGKREINNHPQVIRQHCEDSLTRLGTDCIDLYYLHRWDRQTPIEDCVGEMSRLVEEGKVKQLGLSEVSGNTLRKAHAIHPIAALQTEYSLWTRNAEIDVLQTCEKLGVAFVAFSPLARAFLTGKLTDVSALEKGDLRRNLPRFDTNNYVKNLALLTELKPVAQENGCSLAQLALAWLLDKGEHIIPIPGTTQINHLEENYTATEFILDSRSVARLDELINQNTVHGNRYNEVTQAEIDTEEFG